MKCLKVIKELAQENWTMVIVTHEIQFAKQSVGSSDIYGTGGYIVEQGSPDEVLVHPEKERTKQFLDRILNPA